MDIQKIPIEKINPAKYNPRKDLKPGDPEYEKLKKSILEFDYIDPIIWNKRTGNIVGGHQRFKILKELNLTEIEVSVVDLDENREKALNLALNKTGGDWDIPKLNALLQELLVSELDIEVTGFSEDEIEGLMVEHNRKKKERQKKQIQIADNFKLEDDILQEIEQKRVFFSFSGGKDSSLAAFLMIPILREIKKDFELLFVDTGVELPSVSEYVVRFAEFFNSKLTIIKGGPDFWQYYEPKKRWPSVIYRDCIETLINHPLDNYCFSQLNKGEEYILIRGGRSSQTTTLSKGEKIYTITKGKKKIRLLNPLFDLSEEAFEKYKKDLEEGFGLWEGYKKGFVRTACWCCPFQTKQQYDTIKKELPFLWEILKRKAEEWEFMGDTPLEQYLAKYG